MSLGCGKGLMRLAACLAVLAAWPVDSQAQPVPATQAAGLTILDNDSYLRLYSVHKSPVIATADGQITALALPAAKGSGAVAEFQSPLPPPNWTSPDFDDATWERTRSPVEPRQPDSYTYGNTVAWHAAVANSVICLRGRFVVDDPAKVQDLRLSLEYVGGVAVSVNGQEVARSHLPPGELAADTLAEKYPDDLYCEPGGLFLQDIKKNADGFARRYRRLSDVPVPGRLLRRGINVLAVEIHRAPVNEAAAKAKRLPVGGMSVVPGLWAYAELKSLSLTAAPGSAVVPNIARPDAVEVWICQPYDTVTAFDQADPGEPMPIVLTAAANGVFSARLVASSRRPIKGLRVEATDLVRPDGGGSIPASAVRVRYAVPATAAKSRTPGHRFDGLIEAIPAEIAVVTAAPPRESYLRNGASEGLPIDRKGPSSGAVASLWATVRVSKEAKPGRYEGTIRVSADGLAATTVPLRVNVVGFVLPDPKDFRVQHLGFNSPESVARHYEVPLWSDRHLELMGKSLALMAEINSRQVLVDLAVNFYGLGGNQESVIRWIAQPDGSYKHDLAAFDKFLDTVAKHLGKPSPLRLNCWGEVRPGWKSDDSGKLVSRLDPATGAVEPLKQPELGTPENQAFWKPVLEEVRKRVEARGWTDAVCFGHNSYNAPAFPAIVTVCRSLWPDGAWGYTAHNGTLNMAFATTDKGVTMPVRYSECVWTRGELATRGYRALLKPRPAVWCWAYRGVMRDWSELTLLRGAAEGAILRGHDGVGQMGVDIFPLKGPGNRPYYLNTDRGGLGPSNSTMAILYPGPDGPAATERFEMFREGAQLAEAILFIQRAIEDKKLDGELEQRANRCLDERGTAYLWQWRSGRFERDAALFELAAEVAGRLAAKP